MNRVMEAMRALGPRDYCPCESGHRVEGCCLRGDLLRPPSADVNPKGPRTNYANPGCYLSVVDDNCCSKLTREHFFSESILEILHVEGGSRGVLVGGFPWLSEPRALPPNAIAGKVLCKRHNEALGALDKCALRFYRRLVNVPAHLRDPTGRRHRLYMFNGADLERWTIKALAGLLASGNLTFNGKKFEGEVPSPWLEVLIGRKQLPADLGLGTMAVEGAPPENVSNQIDLRPMFHDLDGVRIPVGAELWINGLALGLVVAHTQDRKPMPWAANHRLHANLIRYSGPSSSVTLMLAGSGWDESTGVEIAWLPNPV